MFQNHLNRRHSATDDVKNKFVVLSQPLLIDSNTVDEHDSADDMGDEPTCGPDDDEDEDEDEDSPDSNVTYDHIR